MATGTNTRGALACSQRRVRAWSLRMTGHTFSAIGLDMGITPQAAHKLVKREMDAYRTQHAEKIENARTLEAERLDALQAGLWDKAVAGDHGAVNSILKIMERRAKLLGLDGPIKVAPTDPTGSEPYDENPTVAGLIAELTALAEGAEKEPGAHNVDTIGVV